MKTEAQKLLARKRQKYNETRTSWIERQTSVALVCIVMAFLAVGAYKICGVIINSMR